mgnify:CR=1 FL=1
MPATVLNAKIWKSMMQTGINMTLQEGQLLDFAAAGTVIKSRSVTALIKPAGLNQK